MEALDPLRKQGILSVYENGLVSYRPVTVVGSGNSPFELVTTIQTIGVSSLMYPLVRFLMNRQGHLIIRQTPI